MSYKNHSKFKPNKKPYPMIIQVLFLFCLLLNQINADLPVHCMMSDVIGEWNFLISKSTFSPSLENEKQTSCGHGIPNSVVSLLNDSDLSLPSHDEIKLELSNDYNLYENKALVGHWTFVYDQSLIIHYKNRILTAPFKYYKKPGRPNAESNCSKTFLGWHIPDKNKISQNWSCFYGEKEDLRVESNKFGFLQISLENYESHLVDIINNTIKTDQIKTGNGASFIQTSEKTETNLENYLKYEQMGRFVNKLNSLDMGWEAGLNPKYVGLSFSELKSKIGLNRGNYNKKNSFEQASFIQINNKKSEEEKESVESYLEKIEKELDQISVQNGNKIGKNKEKENVKDKESKGSTLTIKTNENIKSESESNFEESKSFLFEKKNRKESTKNEVCCVPKLNLSKTNPDKEVKVSEIREQDSKDAFDYKETSKYLHSKLDEIDESKIARNWDWRNVGGINYVPHVRNQGGCGSCYVFSTMTSLESRLRIQTNNQDQTNFSRQFALSCNFYSEGCDGGYPILVSKFFNEFELVPEKCFEYTQSTDKCSNACNDYKLNPKKYTVSEFGYLGGAYGKTSEADMIKEIRARGPIPGNIIVHWSFHYYKKGIFSATKLEKNSKKISQKTLFDYGTTWSKVEHSITLVGYGEEDGVKYWIGMNTWGDDWGENGFFKILRGENESEIESMGDFMNIKVESR